MNTASHVVLICGILTLLHDFPVRAKKGNSIRLKPGVEKCVDVTDRSSSVRLKCGSKDVMYTLEINTYNGTGCDVNVCSGLQPQVLTDSLLCYSRRNCTISFSNTAPIVKTQNALCIGKTPSSLKLSYLCVKKKIFIAVNRNGADMGVDELKLDQGLLVSHATYPWHYAPGLMLNMTLRPKTSDRRTLYLGVPVRDIDSFDQARLMNPEDGEFTDLVATPAGSPLVLQASSGSGLLLVFNTDNASSTGRGFLLCFYWASADEDLSSADICKKVTARKRKGRKKKKGDKRKRKSKSKGGRKRRVKEGRKRKGKKRSKKV